jgi:hypothetical protein
MWVAHNWCGEIVELLATGKVDVDAKSNDGTTLLALVAQKGYEGIITRSLPAGKVDIYAKVENSMTPLAWAD